MAMSVGGTLGITFPDAVTSPAANVSTLFSPRITNASNLTVIGNGGTTFSGTSGLAYSLTRTNSPIVYKTAPIKITIAANTTNYNIKTAAIAAGWNQTTAVVITVTINSGILVGSSSTGSYALDTGVTFPAGTIINLINNGQILGAGGTGGGEAAAGGAGGPAIRAQQTLIITNYGIIGGGGGGGGGGGHYTLKSSDYGGGGGGGGQGYVGGAGGSGGTGANGNGGAGGAGTYIAAGAGGSSGAYVGGNGGTLGSSGSAGQSGGAGGDGGAAITGSLYVTLPVGGTIYGGLS